MQTASAARVDSIGICTFTQHDSDEIVTFVLAGEKEQRVPVPVSVDLLIQGMVVKMKDGLLLV